MKVRPWVSPLMMIGMIPLVLSNVFIPPEHRPGVIDDLRKLMLMHPKHTQGSPPKLDDLYCKCNENGCDAEVIDVAGSNYSGICRVPNGGQCRTIEAFNENGQLHEVHFECIENERLIPVNQPLLCISREDHPRIRQYCCKNASLCNDAIIPQLGPRRIEKFELSMKTVLTLTIVAVSMLSCAAFFACILWLCNWKAKSTMRKYILRLPFFNQSHLSAQLSDIPTFGNGDDINEALIEYDNGRRNVAPITRRTMARQITVSDVTIARGRFGEVKLGDWKGEKVAVKIFNSRDEQSFWRESGIYSSTGLKHPSLLRYIASDNLDSGIQTQLLIVLEYVPNGALYDYLSENCVSRYTGLRMIQTIIHGLTYLHTDIPGISNDCHKPPIAHRDMKSKNVLVKKDLTCCIADLGMALPSTADDYESEKKFGTIRYMAPELFSDDVPTFNTFILADIYATSLIIWEIARRMNYRSDGGSYPYSLPFSEYCDRDPSFDEMRDIVVKRELRPKIDVRWESDDALKVLARIMTECFSPKPSSRLTALNIRLQTDRLFNIEEERIEKLKRERKLQDPTVLFIDDIIHYTPGILLNTTSTNPTSTNDSLEPGTSKSNADPLQVEAPRCVPPLNHGIHSNADASDLNLPQVVIAGTRSRSGSRASNRGQFKNPRPLSPLCEKD